MSQDLPPIGEHVREKRVQAGMTQQALASVAGLSVSVVSQLEQGTNADPRMSTILALSRALGVGADELLSDRKPPLDAPDAAGRGKKAVRRKRKTKGE